MAISVSINIHIYLSVASEIVILVFQANDNYSITKLICPFANLAPILKSLVAISHDPGANGPKTTFKVNS